MTAFRHPLLHVGVLSHPQQVALYAALGLHRAEQPLVHEYVAKESATDAFVKRQRKAGR